MKVFIQLAIGACVLVSHALIAETNLIELKGFLANPPPIREFAAVFVDQGKTNGDTRYCYVRYQDGDFVALQSFKNEMVLEGMTDQSDGLPTGVGKFGEYYWFFYGNADFMSVLEWEGPEMNAPPDVGLRLMYNRQSPLNELLTLGCHVAPAGSFKWVENWVHISLTNAEIDAELLLGANGQAQGMRYGLRRPGAKERKSMPESFWLFEYEYPNPDIPPGIPSLIRRYFVSKDKRREVSKVEIRRLVVAQERMTREAFLPSQFISPNARLVGGKFDGNKKALHIDGK